MKTITTIIALTTLTAAAVAGPLTFDFKDPKGVNNATFKLDAPLEAISGSASGITGTVTFDPANPAATTGTIRVASQSLTVPNPMMQGHLLGDKWLDTAKFSEISFAVKAMANVKTEGNTTSADASGTFTLKGVAKEMTIPVKLTYLPGKLAQRVPNLRGDLLVVRASFQITRSDFALMPGQMEEKVANTIDVTLSVAGAAPK
jgi:polyisoprenoid-binding protein YceI